MEDRRGLPRLAALIGIRASVSDTIPISAAASIHGEGLAFAVQLPIVAACVVAAVLARGGDRRAAICVVSSGASVPLVAHILGSIPAAGACRC